MAFVPSLPKRGINVRCDRCPNVFNLSKSNLKVRRASEEELDEYEILRENKHYKLHKIYYVCPNCKKEFIVGFIDSYLKNTLGPLIKRESLKEKPNKEKLEMLQSQYKTRMDKINNRLPNQEGVKS